MGRAQSAAKSGKRGTSEAAIRTLGRPRAADHDAKRQAILHKATELFAENGYARSSISEITAECGVSKALLYHYYANKEDLLFAILEAHFERLTTDVREVDKSSPDPVVRLRALVGALLRSYEGQDATHKVQIHDRLNARKY
jgi:TetR/AcrR family transcriptional regulator